MTSRLYEDLALEEGVKQYFHADLTVREVLLHEIPVSHTMTATVFLSDKNQLYVYISGESRTKLGDIQKIISRMGLKAVHYLPPHGEKDYFQKVAKKHFTNTFPGRSSVSDNDLAYYRTLAPYSPALVQISEVTKSIIYQYDTDSPSKWRMSLHYSYRRIATI